MTEPLPTAGRLTVSVVTGLVVERDAISNVCVQQIAALDEFARSRQMVLDLKLFLHGTTVLEPRAVKVQDPTAVVCDPHFQRSDVVLYQFGIYYPLFDSLPLAPRTARVVVNYYGITPPGVTAPESHDVLHRSFRQAANLFHADRVMVNSRHIGDEARAMGIAPDRLRLLPLAAAFDLPDTIPAKAPGDVLRLAYLGRLVPAKGVRELLAAAARLADTRPVHLTLMGARQFSDADVVRDAEAAAAAGPLAGRLDVLLDRPGPEVRDRLSAADLFVMPSHHEGFCVPVIEAVACGAGLVHSAAGALPETGGGLGQTFPAGDTAALFAALVRFGESWDRGLYATDDGPLAADRWRAKALAHLQTFRRETFARTFLQHVLGGVQPLSPDRAAVRDEARLHAVHLLRPAPATVGEPVAVSHRLHEVMADPRGHRRNRGGRRPALLTHRTET